MKATLKKFKKMTQEGNKEEAKKFLPEVYKVLDKWPRLALSRKIKLKD
jgi:ribosomal protein S20